MQRILPGALVFLVAAVHGYAAECVAQAPAARSHLVELYTSEGCDSCPPAEKWLTTLRKHPGLVGLEYHVTYWDNSEWRDPFSAQVYTDRQKTLAKRSNHDVVVTPQIWVDGHLWSNWPKGTPPSFNDSAATPLTVKLTTTTGQPLHATLDANPTDAKAADSYRLYAALIESDLTSAVTGGENKGKKLSHDDVVRAFAGPLPLPHADVELPIPEHVNLSKAGVVVFVEDERDGSIGQVVDVPLARCLN